ncbi:hypothetical protein AB9P05_20840 [Roseivirga sp. BDSF3-8]|uniref:hypothetical protein n=1 Tax=Roseivirga sp. BDSF3-8 TaxID=3241598 RepID=UPI003532013B
MKRLDDDWVVKDLIDLEYKKYILLAYLKEVENQFKEKKLYPYLSEIVSHYRNLLVLKREKTLMYDKFPATLSKADFERLKMTYTRLVEDTELMAEIDSIVDFAIPECRRRLEDGKDIYEEVENSLNIEPIGLVPIYNDEGYFFIAQEKDKDLDIYRYRITIFDNSEERYRAISTELLDRTRSSLARTYEQLKLELIRNNPDLPNPATYLIHANSKVPYECTLLPVAKRLLVRYINPAA